ncbi:MAG: M14 family metallopeptidase [Pseudomonadota bacterium]
MFRPLASLCLILSFLTGHTIAAPPFPENTVYDQKIPTIMAVLGYEAGADMTTPEDAVRYLAALASAAPDRMRVFDYGESWQGRKLQYAVITSSERMLELDEVKAAIATLAAGNPLTNEKRSALLDRAAPVTWLSYGVHGDEISSTDAALSLAYHLLGAQNDPKVQKILDETIVVIDPVQNPDGRARFINAFKDNIGIAPSKDRWSAEHVQPWPRGRFNHYLFDLNRDWFALSQPETRSRISAYLEWNPVVFVDAHEMGGDQTYFFPPSANPINPFVTPTQLDKQTLIGRENGRAMDEAGQAYFTREIFDAFYPGYGDTWPTLNGAIGMTYEQASPSGLVYEKRDGAVFSYADAVRNHFITSLTTAHTVAQNASKFLADFAGFRRDGVANGEKSSSRFHYIDRSASPTTARKLATRLHNQGVSVDVIDGAKTFCGEGFDAGAYVIDAAQPNHALIQNVLSPSIALPQRFVQEQEARRKRGLPHQLYDATAWSLPLMDGLRSVSCSTAPNTETRRFSDAEQKTAPELPPANFGYAVPWKDASHASLIMKALASGIRGKTVDAPFTIGDQLFPRGSVIFPNAENDSGSRKFSDTLTVLNTAIGAEIAPLSKSFTTTGPNYGSGRAHRLKAPKIALAWGETTRPLSAGSTRYIIEQNLGTPVNVIRVSSLARANLSAYDVLILPDTTNSFVDRLGLSGVSAIFDFVDNGGVLISVAGSVKALSEKPFNLLETSLEDAASSEDSSGAAGTDGDTALFQSTDEYEAYLADHDRSPDDAPGALLSVEADADHWLASGYSNAVTYYEGEAIFSPLKLNDGANVFRYAGADTLVASGYLWSENQNQLAYKPFVMTTRSGKGIVIAFTQSPTKRAYLNGLTLLLANALVLGPAHAH